MEVRRGGRLPFNGESAKLEGGCWVLRPAARSSRCAAVATQINIGDWAGRPLALTRRESRLLGRWVGGEAGDWLGHRLVRMLRRRRREARRKCRPLDGGTSPA